MKSESETTEKPNSQKVEHCDNNVPNHGPHLPISHQAICEAQSEQINSNNTPLRRGKWTPEEEAYALAAIRDFNSGYLDAPPGTTLRTFLSERLQCDPMRITKKFTGDASIGKKVFHPAVRDDPKILKGIQDSQANLGQLYQNWKHRLESQEQEMTRKSMADAAVSVASSLCDNPNQPSFSAASSSYQLHTVSFMQVPREVTNKFNTNKADTLSANGKKHVTKTATWLEQAEALLSKKSEENQLEKEIKEEMQAISHLIKEAPEILAMSADLPKLLGDKPNLESSGTLQPPINKLHSCSADLRILCASSEMEHNEQSVSTPTTGKRKCSQSDKIITDSPNASMRLLASLSSQAAPVPIASKDVGEHTTAGSNTIDSKQIPNHHVDAEDAEAFVSAVQQMMGHSPDR